MAKQVKPKMVKMVKKPTKRINKKIIITGIIAGLLLATAMTMTVLFIKGTREYDELWDAKWEIQKQLGEEKTERQKLEKEKASIQNDADYNSYMWDVNNELLGKMEDMLLRADQNFIDMYNYVIQNVDGSYYFEYKMDNFHNIHKQIQSEYVKLNEQTNKLFN